ncbi:MAG TPA: response regulator transcription factor [Solirubrobacteraceae bacterium]|nr:response regulator transcription factor [Solirubrobacteraceae bacterium]
MAGSPDRGWIERMDTTTPAEPTEQNGHGASTAPITVLIADDHSFARRSLRALLDADPGVEVIGEALDIQSTIRDVIAHAPEVLVLDVSMPGGSVFTAIREIRLHAPQTAIVVTTMLDDARIAREAIAAGACAYVLKERAGDHLPAAIRAASDGGRFVAPELAALLAAYEERTDRLSMRELEVLRLISLGYTNVEIGGLLHLSVRTVETHRAHILTKLGLSTRAELVRYALRRGLLAAGAAARAPD